MKNKEGKNNNICISIKNYYAPITKDEKGLVNVI